MPDVSLPIESQDGASGSYALTRVDINTWILDVAGCRVVLDPWFYDPATIPVALALRHADPLPISIADVGAVNAVLVSHHDPDHFDLRALRELASEDTTLVGTPPACRKARTARFGTVAPLRHWDTVDLCSGSLRVTAVPGLHPHFMRENGYVIEGGGRTLYFGADTALIDALTDIGDRFDIDIALLPCVGITMPVLGRIVMNAQEAVEAIRRLRARTVLPTSVGGIHFSGLLGSRVRATSGPEDLARLIAESELPVTYLSPAPGETVRFDETGMLRA